VLELRVAGHDEVVPPHKEDDIVVAPLIDRVHVLYIGGQAVPEGAELYRVVPGPALLADSPEIFPFEGPHLAPYDGDSVEVGVTLLGGGRTRRQVRRDAVGDDLGWGFFWREIRRRSLLLGRSVEVLHGHSVVFGKGEVLWDVGIPGKHQGVRNRAVGEA